MTATAVPGFCPPSRALVPSTCTGPGPPGPRSTAPPAAARSATSPASPAPPRSSPPAASPRRPPSSKSSVDSWRFPHHFAGQCGKRHDSTSSRSLKRAFSGHSGSASTLRTMTDSSTLSRPPILPGRLRPTTLARWVLIIGLAAGLGAVLFLWWHNTPAVTGSTAEELIAAGRLTGLAGAYLILVQLLLMSRLQRLDRA